MIAKISSGSSFRGALDYLMSVKTKDRQPVHTEQQEKKADRSLQRDGPRRARQEMEPGREEVKREKAEEKRARDAPHEQVDPEREERAPGYEKGERHRLIGGNMSGRTPRELAREFELIRAQRPDIAKPVHHVSISAGEHDRVSVEEWQEVAAKYIERMGYKNSPYVVIQHRDGNRDHIHILTSRVDVQGRVVRDWQNKQRAEKVMRQIEREHNLERVQSSHEVLRAAPTRAELDRFNRTGDLSAKMSLQGHVEQALKGHPTATEFIKRLERSGVEVIPYLQSTGRVSGISFRQGKELMKGSDLGRGFSWNALQKRGLDYDAQRDRPALEAAKQRFELSRDGARLTTIVAPTRDLTDSIDRSAGQNLLDKANPVKQVESQIHVHQQLGQEIVDNTAKDLLAQQHSRDRLREVAGLSARDTLERLHQAAVPDTGKDTIERLQQAAGIEPLKGDHDALERLNQAIGLERKDLPTDLIHTPDKALEHTPEMIPTLEPKAEEHVIDLAIELTR